MGEGPYNAVPSTIPTPRVKGLARVRHRSPRPPSSDGLQHTPADQGRCDSPLTDLGREQARAAAAWLHGRGVRFDAAFSSPPSAPARRRRCSWWAVCAPHGPERALFRCARGDRRACASQADGRLSGGVRGRPEQDLTGRLNGAMHAIACGDLERDAATEHTSASAALPIPGRSDAPIEACAIEPLPTGAPRTGNVLVVSHGAACKTLHEPGASSPRTNSPIPSPTVACSCIDTTMAASPCSKAPTPRRTSVARAPH